MVQYYNQIILLHIVKIVEMSVWIGMGIAHTTIAIIGINTFFRFLFDFSGFLEFKSSTKIKNTDIFKIMKGGKLWYWELSVQEA